MYLHVNLSLTHIRVGINTPRSSKKLYTCLPLDSMTYTYIKSAVIYTLYLPLQYSLGLLTCIIPNTVPLINLVLHDLTTKVLGGNAEVGKGTLNLPLLYRCNFRDEGRGISPSYFPITQQFILSLS
jgi:hypothetical protein